MRSIYLTKPKDTTCSKCGGPKRLEQIGVTLGGEPLYSCDSDYHDIRVVVRMATVKGD